MSVVDNARFRELMCCFSREAVLAQRAAITVAIAKKVIRNCFPVTCKIIVAMDHQPVNDAIVRNGLQIFRLVKIPTSLESRSSGDVFSVDDIRGIHPLQ